MEIIEGILMLFAGLFDITAEYGCLAAIGMLALVVVVVGACVLVFSRL